MIKSNEPFTALNKAVIDSLMTLANTSLVGTERLAALNLNTARAFVSDSAANVNALLAAKDPQALLAVQGSMSRPAIEKAAAYSRSVYEILNESSNGLTQVVEEQASEMKKNLSAAIEQSLKNAPAGSEPVVAVVKTALAQADSAYETMANSAKQAKAMLEANVASATATAKAMAKAA